MQSAATNRRARNSQRHRGRPQGRVWARLVALFVAAGYIAFCALSPMPTVQASVVVSEQTSPAAIDLAWPTATASAIGGTLWNKPLATNGQTTALPMASITKIVTALVVLEKYPLQQGELGQTITFTSADQAIYSEYVAKDGSTLPADAGTSLTEQEILAGMLVASANNYADSLAVWAYGSMDSYLAAAAEYLDDHGLTDTSVADASGFSADSKTTAAELVEIGVLALRDSTIASIVQQPSVTLPSIGTVYNTNILVRTGKAVGIKTGTTDEAGACLLYAIEVTVGSTPVTLVGASLGAADHTTLSQEVSTLVETATAALHEHTFTEADVVASYQAPWGTSANATITEPITLLSWQDNPVTVEVSANMVATANLGDTAGSVSFTANGSEQTVPLTFSESLGGPSLVWRLTHPLELL